MQDMNKTLEEYKETYEKLRQLTAYLTGEISSLSKNAKPRKSLIERRALLYEQISENLGSIRMIQDYLGIEDSDLSSKKIRS